MAFLLRFSAPSGSQARTTPTGSPPAATVVSKLPHHHLAARAPGFAAALPQQRSTPEEQQTGRPLLAAAALVTSALLSFSSPATSYAAYASQTDGYGQQQAAPGAYSQEDEEDEEDDVGALPQEPAPELLSFVAKYDTLSAEQLAVERQRLGFSRSADGRVFLMARGGEQFAVKPDMQAPGFLLLRDQDGYCFYIPPDPAGQLVQIDLSDDLIVAQLFANGVWQELLEPLDAQAEDGRVQQLQMSTGEFRQVLSLLEGAMEGDEEELPE